ncbi:hypothetical protein ACFY2R_18260 [Micromonospora olivasterospora]|uniref:hypothetical protein n=1 Tax=Micromonospora olivasterospora TaxID=1880 RepID=UPI001FE7AC68|nr:hypothetical protein [Micromonospora olivasterospora]
MAQFLNIKRREQPISPAVAAGMTDTVPVQHDCGPTSMTISRLIICHRRKPAQVRDTAPGRYACHGTLAALTGVEPYEVAQVLSARRRLPLAATSGGLPFVAVLGRTQAGRPLVVAVRKVGKFDQQIIGAREMNAAELKRFEAWEMTR